MLNIALPKGRLAKTIYPLLSAVGYSCPLMEEDNRLLMLENPEKGVRYLLTKPSDVAVYVEHGAADLGVVGKDVLEEGQNKVFELLDLDLGKCRMSVCVPDGYQEDPEKVLRVATKYPNITRGFYAAKNRQIELIVLHGSIELAPLSGLSDVIVDLVETGGTLRENHLHVEEVVLPVSARLIANKSSYRFQREEIERIKEALRPQREEETV